MAGFFASFLEAEPAGHPPAVVSPSRTKPTFPRQQGIPPSPANQRTLPLIKVMQVRKLSGEQAARSVPVKLKGVVTDLSGWRNSFFFQDSTGGISVDRTDKAAVRVGDEVELTGIR